MGLRALRERFMGRSAHPPKGTSMLRLRHGQTADRRHPVIRALQRMRPLASILFFSVAVIVCFAAIDAESMSHASGTGPNQATDPNGTPILSKGQAAANAHCNVANKPACSTRAVPWVSLRSDSPADVLTAAKSTAMFQSALASADPIGAALKAGVLGQPVLVKPYHDGTVLDTVWVIPVVSGSGSPSALLEFVYDRPHQRLRAASFDAVGNGMFYASHSFPFTDGVGACAVAHQARNVSLMTGRVAELVYFPTDHAAVLSEQSPPWTGGGDSVLAPICRAPGRAGHRYYLTPE